jgi:hypothetical protein
LEVYLGEEHVEIKEHGCWTLMVKQVVLTNCSFENIDSFYPIMSTGT